MSSPSTSPSSRTLRPRAVTVGKSSQSQEPFRPPCSSRYLPREFTHAFKCCSHAPRWEPRRSTWPAFPPPRVRSNRQAYLFPQPLPPPSSPQFKSAYMKATIERRGTHARRGDGRAGDRVVEDRHGKRRPEAFAGQVAWYRRWPWGRPCWKPIRSKAQAFTGDAFAARGDVCPRILQAEGF
jgi:hypothetical protein